MFYSRLSSLSEASQRQGEERKHFKFTSEILILLSQFFEGGLMYDEYEILMRVDLCRYIYYILKILDV
jgi:hypothetical protein